MSTTPTPKPPSRLDQIISYLDVGVSFFGELQGIVPGAGIAILADKFLKIAQKAVRAHESLTGEPLDLERLHELPHV